MKSGDLFEFLDYENNRAQPHHAFYDELLKRWIHVNDNIFVCLAHIKNPDWGGRYDHSLFFTDFSHIFHMCVDVTFEQLTNKFATIVYSIHIIE